MDGGEDREVRSDLECIYSGDGAWWPVDTKKTRVLASDDGDIELRVRGSIIRPFNRACRGYALTSGMGRLHSGSQGCYEDVRLGVIDGPSQQLILFLMTPDRMLML